MKFSPAYSLWSNEKNERNHASADLTIRKLMEEKKTPLSNSLIKAASWAHNSSVNKLSYTPLQLVTGKAVTLPGLTTGNEGMESMTDCKAVQCMMERLNNTVSEFCEVDMKKNSRNVRDCGSSNTNTSADIVKVIKFGTSPCMKTSGLVQQQFCASEARAFGSIQTVI